MVTDLEAAIQQIYPFEQYGLLASRDYEVVKGDAGEYVSRWTNPNPLPNAAQLEAARVPAMAKAKRRELDAAFDAACRRDIGEGGFYEVLGAVLSDQIKRAALTSHLARLATLRKQTEAVVTKDPGDADRQLRAVGW